MSTHEQLLLNYGHDLITVTTANANSYPKGDACPAIQFNNVVAFDQHYLILCCILVRMTLQEYIQKEMKPQSINKLGSG